MSTPEKPKRRRGRPTNAEIAARKAAEQPNPKPPEAEQPQVVIGAEPDQAPEPPTAPAPKPSKPSKAAKPVPGSISAAASDLGRRGLGKKKTLTPEQRAERGNQAREMTRRRIQVRGIVVDRA